MFDIDKKIGYCTGFITSLAVSDNILLEEAVKSLYVGVNTVLAVLITNIVKDYLDARKKRKAEKK
jgi:hypothetical protein